MDAFGAYSDSEEDAGEETEAPKPLALQDEDSGVEDEDEAGAGSAAKDATAAAIAAVQAAADASKAAPKRKLPSALDALSTGGTKPSFLQGGNDSEFEVVELKERRLAPQDPEDGPPPLAPPLKKPRDASTAQISAPPAPPSAPAGGATGHMRRTYQHDDNGDKAAAAAPKKKHVDVKEKVKEKRLKGQTLGRDRRPPHQQGPGVDSSLQGGETTRWKSEGEMLLRQQYD